MKISDEKLFQLVVEPGHISQENFFEAQKKRKRNGKDLWAILLEEALILDEQLGQLYAEDRGWPFINLRKEKIDEKVLEMIPEVMARSKNLIAFTRNDKGVKIAMTNLDDTETVHNLEKKFDTNVQVVFSTERDVGKALHYYRKDIRQEIGDLIKFVKNPNASQDAKNESIIKIVNLMIQHGFFNRTSDIHIEPLSEHASVRFRIDGVMHQVADLPWKIYESVLRRIKILSKIRIDEQRKAQDGKFRFQADAEEIDVRVSIVPVTHGENVVMRLLSNTNKQLSLDSLGFSTKDFSAVSNALSVPHGMILVTGPTGSGKTSTLYEFIKTINSEAIHVASIEDPVEYDIEGISQIQVNAKTDLTFAKGLRAIVRQDPDVIMVGEIRDQETAKIAVNSAMTGHLVLSTLHTNDSATTLPRLLDMGVEPYLIASTVNLVIAQRLVRMTCEKCRYSYGINAEEIAMIRRRKGLEELISKKMKKDLESLTLFKGEGCRVCSKSGYSGRMGIFEVLSIDEDVKMLIMNQASSGDITKKARENGMTSLTEDGLAKVFSGATTLSEVLRVTGGVS